MKLENGTKEAIPARVNQTNLVFCWFVEDNGNGNKGYVFMDTARNTPLEPSEHLFSNITKLSEALQRGGKAVFLVPKCPGWVPEGWRVRNLNSNEVNELSGFSRLTILRE
jgi:hypothetical protein